MEDILALDENIFWIWKQFLRGLPGAEVVLDHFLGLDENWGSYLLG